MNRHVGWAIAHQRGYLHTDTRSPEGLCDTKIKKETIQGEI
jgi:hypothetical protein